LDALQDGRGETALMLASFFGNTAIVQLLVDAGAEKEIRTAVRIVIRAMREIGTSSSGIKSFFGVCLTQFSTFSILIRLYDCSCMRSINVLSLKAILAVLFVTPEDPFESVFIA